VDLLEVVIVSVYDHLGWRITEDIDNFDNTEKHTCSRTSVQHSFNSCWVCYSDWTSL